MVSSEGQAVVQAALPFRPYDTADTGLEASAVRKGAGNVYGKPQWENHNI